MTRQRTARQDSSLPATGEQEQVDPTLAAVARAGGAGPDRMMSGLLHLDQSTRGRAVQRLQAGAGNRAVGALIGVQPARMSIQRDGDEPTEQGPVPLDTTAATGAGASEQIGPPALPTYSLNAMDLADVASIISVRPEAGHVTWSEDMVANGSPAKGMDSVSVTVSITMEMPAWDPPSTMLPKARAEWDRWYAALLAHEQGHVTLVHEVHDGLAAKIMGKSKPVADSMWATAQATLTKNSKAYDVRTGHGLKTGTVLNVGIETAELAEEARKKAAAAKAATPSSATADTPVAE